MNAPDPTEHQQLRERPTVAVLMGGPSGEHEISLKSGHGVVEALTRRGYQVHALIIPNTVTVPNACELAKSELRRLQAMLAFIALHGPFGEDGTIQQVCEELSIRYTGSDATASRFGMDKVASRRRFEAAGLHVPRWQTVQSTTPAARLTKTIRGLSYPLVVKPIDQGSSLGVSKVDEVSQLPHAFDVARQYGCEVLVEEFVAGREVTAGVLGDEALPVVEIRSHNAFFDYRAKYTVGMTEYLVPALLDETTTRAVQTAGLTAHRALGCRHLSRTDIIVTPTGVPIVLEVNTIPGFTPTSLLPKAAAQAGLSYDELCEQLVLMAWHGTSHAVPSVSSILS